MCPSSKTFYKCLREFLIGNVTISLLVILNCLHLGYSLVINVQTLLFNLSTAWFNGEKQRTKNKKTVKELTQSFTCRE